MFCLSYLRLKRVTFFVVLMYASNVQANISLYLSPLMVGGALVIMRSSPLFIKFSIGERCQYQLNGYVGICQWKMLSFIYSVFILIHKIHVNVRTNSRPGTVGRNRSMSNIGVSLRVSFESWVALNP